MPVITNSPWTAAHSLNVALIVDGVERDLHQPDDSRATNVVSGLLHDIGKEGNPALPLDVVNKQGTLTPGEWKAMQTHPREGFKRLVNTGERRLFPVAMRVVGHHEHQGRRSYPRKCIRPGSDQAVLHGQRVIALGDTIDALFDPARPYKDPWTAAQVRKEVGEKFGDFFPSSVLDTAVSTGEIFVANRG